MKKTVFSWRTIIVDFDTETSAKDWIAKQKEKYGGECLVRSEGLTANETFKEQTGIDEAYTVEMSYANSPTISCGW